jgi:hypothetical protein
LRPTNSRGLERDIEKRGFGLAVLQAFGEHYFCDPPAVRLKLDVDAKVIDCQ